MVMLIDDDSDECDIFIEAVQEVSEYQCNCVFSSAEALDILDAAKKIPSCIFVDINMPG